MSAGRVAAASHDFMTKESHAGFMRRCVELAELARQTRDFPVGAIVVQDSRIFSEATEAVRANLDVTAHAEVRLPERTAPLTCDERHGKLNAEHSPCVSLMKTYWKNFTMGAGAVFVLFLIVGYVVDRAQTFRGRIRRSHRVMGLSRLHRCRLRSGHTTMAEKSGVADTKLGGSSGSCPSVLIVADRFKT